MSNRVLPVMNILRALALIPVLALAVVGCGSAPEQPAASNTAAPIAPPAMLAFGQSHTWPNGDVITISQPRRRQLASQFSGRVDNYITVDVTVHNAGTAAKEATSYMLDATVNDQAISRYAVSEFGPQQQGFIAPGGTLHFTNAYQTTDPAPAKFGIQAVGEQLDPGRPVIFYEGTA